jgi:hypothetical protein
VLSLRIIDPAYPALIDPARLIPCYPAEEKNQKIPRPD